mmetsp:Transcript_7896/g.18371  ORF Transcript_7896/g.18371 Transcript_7896/m.18371 type:complete len:91 (+) Transcript_7896:2-274(+)
MARRSEAERLLVPPVLRQSPCWCAFGVPSVCCGSPRCCGSEVCPRCYGSEGVVTVCSGQCARAGYSVQRAQNVVHCRNGTLCTDCCSHCL